MPNAPVPLLDVFGTQWSWSHESAWPGHAPVPLLDVFGTQCSGLPESAWPRPGVSADGEAAAHSCEALSSPSFAWPPYRVHAPRRSPGPTSKNLPPSANNPNQATQPPARSTTAPALAHPTHSFAISSDSSHLHLVPSRASNTIT